MSFAPELTERVSPLSTFLSESLSLSHTHTHTHTHIHTHTPATLVSHHVTSRHCTPTTQRDSTREETRAELETAELLSTMACLKYRSIPCSIEDYHKHGYEKFTLGPGRDRETERETETEREMESDRERVRETETD